MAGAARNRSQSHGIVPDSAAQLGVAMAGAHSYLQMSDSILPAIGADAGAGCAPASAPSSCQAVSGCDSLALAQTAFVGAQGGAAGCISQTQPFNCQWDGANFTDMQSFSVSQHVPWQCPSGSGLPLAQPSPAPAVVKFDGPMEPSPDDLFQLEWRLALVKRPHQESFAEVLQLQSELLAIPRGAACAILMRYELAEPGRYLGSWITVEVPKWRKVNGF